MMSRLWCTYNGGSSLKKGTPSGEKEPVPGGFRAEIWEEKNFDLVRRKKKYFIQKGLTRILYARMKMGLILGEKAAKEGGTPSRRKTALGGEKYPVLSGSQ